MPKLYHVRATLDYLVSAADRHDAEAELNEAIFDADADQMTVQMTEFKLGDRLPHGWALDSEVYGDESLTVADCIARLAIDANQIPLALGAVAA